MEYILIKSFKMTISQLDKFKSHYENSLFVLRNSVLPNFASTALPINLTDGLKFVLVHEKRTYFCEEPAPALIGFWSMSWNKRIAFRYKNNSNTAGYSQQY